MWMEGIKIAVGVVGICLIMGFFLRLSYLHRRNLKIFDDLSRMIEEKLVNVSHKIDLVDRQLQDMRMDIKDLNMRTNIVETRLEERNAALFLSATISPPSTLSSPKRGRPKKTLEK